MENPYIDITFPLSTRLPKWPGSIGFEMNWQMRMPININNSSFFTIDSHLGTHLDAPLHFVEKGRHVADIDFDKLIGLTYVVEIKGLRSITVTHLEAANIPLKCTKLLLKTDNQHYWKKGLTDFQEDFCSIDATGAQWLVDRNIHLIGIDYLSIQRFKDGPETHQILLKNEVVVLETINLENVECGWYDLICLPLKLEGFEASPVRAILKKI